MLTPEQVAEIRERAEAAARRYVTNLPVRDDVLTLLADRAELVRRLAKAEAELEVLREIATSGPFAATGPSPLSHRGAT